MGTFERKDEHIKLAKTAKSQYNLNPGFDEIEFIHNSLPEIDLEEVDISTKFLNKNISAPFMIAGMTGGSDLAKKINQKLAAAAQKHNIPFGLGSIRPMLEKKEIFHTYDVRKLCPSIPLIANIGAIQLKEYNYAQIEQALEKIQADALAVHLNPLQESIQPEGQTNYSKVYEKIIQLSENINFPIIIKETGAGISKEVAQKFSGTKIAYIDVSGKGGTSWSKIEYMRGGKITGFEEWGNYTALCVAEVSKILKTIASGGIRDGIDVSKALALGAEMAAAAKPFLDLNNIDRIINLWKEQLKRCLFLTGSKNITELKNAKLLIYGKTAQIFQARGIDLKEYALRQNTK